MKPIDATNLTLFGVLDKLGWYATQSTIEGHFRIYDHNRLLVNVMEPGDVWALLEERELVTRKKEHV